MPSRWEEYKERLQSFRSEYAVLAYHWRFSQGLRFILLGVAATAFSGLLGAYRVVLLASIVKTSTTLDHFLAILVPFAGLVLSFVADAMERAIEHMLTATTLRGRVLEEKLHILNGMFADVGTGVMVRQSQLTVPRVMRVVFVISHIGWIVLLALAIWSLLT